MASSASIAQEYVKVQEYWNSIDEDRNWRLCIWSAQYEDVEIIDKFMEVERSVYGRFDNDIVFRFETEYRGDDNAFESGLWEEWISWFEEKPDPKYDILLALKNNDMLLDEYVPDKSLAPTAQNLWKEILRFKASIEELDDVFFCVYIPPSRTDGKPLTDWFSFTLDKKVPEGIRLVTIDYAQNKKVKISASDKVKILRPKLNMPEAVSNDMEKGIVGGDPGKVENQYTLQIKRTMDCTLKKDEGLLDKEVKKLLSLAQEINTPSTAITTLFIAAQAYFSIREKKKSFEYADKAIEESEEAMSAGIPEGYPIWRSAVMLKAALLAGDKNKKAAIELYEKLAREAVKRQDAFYAMEAYRMAGYYLYDTGKSETALETLLLSLQAGSYQELDTRRNSTFIPAAALALGIARSTWEDSKIAILENQLEEWLGNDWRDLVESGDMQGVEL